MLGGSNAPSGATEFNQYSLNFDGVDDFVNLGNAANLRPFVSGGITLSIWCKWVDITTATSRIFSSGSKATAYNGISCSKNSSGFLSLNTGDGGGLSSSNRKTRKTDSVAISNNTWHHIVFIWGSENSATWGIAVDGSPVASSASGTGGNTVYNTDDAFIGKRLSSTNAANGFMDEVSFWDKALSLSEVTAIYNSGVPTDLSSESGLIGYWRNGDTKGPIAFPTIDDFSTNSNDGTMTNMDSGDIVTDVP